MPEFLRIDKIKDDTVRRSLLIFWYPIMFVIVMLKMAFDALREVVPAACQEFKQVWQKPNL